ncbi:unnamed protein product [Somion occarium]|uniref:Enoyl reductase (ER) domain-containing protein n=1 Tax=Somion occarium TaxID=3059160 RepID=A0ABP1EBC3_9APHY
MIIPMQQKALLLLEKKGRFSVETIDVPTPGPGEILVRLEAVSLNSVEWKIQTTDFVIDDFPAVLGQDAAGVVIQLGENVDMFSIGDKVFYQGFFKNRLAAFQQYSVASADLVAKVPSNLSFDQAASIPLVFATATVGLYGSDWERGGAGLTPFWYPEGQDKYAGQPILIIGGSSSVGQYASQLAKLSGFSPVITTVSPQNYGLAKALGATHVLNRNLSTKELLREVKKITAEPIQYVFNTIGSKPTQETSYGVLAPGGTLIQVVASLLDQDKLVSEKKVLYIGGNFHFPPNRLLGAGLYSRLTDLFESGVLKPNNVEVIPGGLAAIPDALERLKKGEVSARKLIVHPPETI